MKRLHLHITVSEIENSIQFYSSVFGQEPNIIKDDYAKWLLDDPQVNFAISKYGNKTGLDHLGIEMENAEELASFSNQLNQAELKHRSEKGSSCCYSKSDKYWVLDPQGIAWEAFLSYGSTDENCGGGVEVKGDTISCCIPVQKSQDKSNTEKSNDKPCCIPSEKSSCCN